MIILFKKYLYIEINGTKLFACIVNSDKMFRRFGLSNALGHLGGQVEVGVEVEPRHVLPHHRLQEEHSYSCYLQYKREKTHFVLSVFGYVKSMALILMFLPA